MMAVLTGKIKSTNQQFMALSKLYVTIIIRWGSTPKPDKQTVQV